jgi:hypothetical protein
MMIFEQISAHTSGVFGPGGLAKTDPSRSRHWHLQSAALPSMTKVKSKKISVETAEMYFIVLPL